MLCQHYWNVLWRSIKITVKTFLHWPASWLCGQNFWLLAMRSRVRFPVLPWKFSFTGEDPHSDHGLGGLQNLGLRPLLVLDAHTYHHSHHRGNVTAPYGRPKPQKSVTFRPQPGGGPRSLYGHVYALGGGGESYTCQLWLPKEYIRALAARPTNTSALDRLGVTAEHCLLGYNTVHLAKLLSPKVLGNAASSIFRLLNNPHEINKNRPLNEPTGRRGKQHW
jgi:hypothetical protein